MSTSSNDRIAEFTPGPWRVIDDTDVLALEGTPSSIVVAATKFFEGPSTSWERANARLIAAAPALLEALIELREAGARGSAEFDAAVPKAEAAIAKAKGRGADYSYARKPRERQLPSITARQPLAEGTPQ